MVTFSFDNYVSFRTQGRLDPPGCYAPFIHADPVKFHALAQQTKTLGKAPDFANIEKRTGKRFYDRLRGACGLTCRFSPHFLPGYRFLLEEYLRDEWLAAVGWHKKFHRDHLIHQPLTVYVGLSLLTDLRFPSLAPAHCQRCAHILQCREEDGPPSLLTLCLDNLRDAFESSYLHEYLRSMGAPERFLDTTNPPLWRMLWAPLFLDSFFWPPCSTTSGTPGSFRPGYRQISRPARLETRCSGCRRRKSWPSTAIGSCSTPCAATNQLRPATRPPGATASRTSWPTACAPRTASRAHWPSSTSMTCSACIPTQSIGPCAASAWNGRPWPS